MNKEKKVLVFPPAWHTPELWSRTSQALREFGFQPYLVEDPEDMKGVTLDDLRANARKQVIKLSEFLDDGEQFVGIGLSQGSVTLKNLLDDPQVGKLFEDVALYGTPMLSRRLSWNSIQMTWRMLTTWAYIWPILKALLFGIGGSLSLQRRDVVKFLFNGREDHKNSRLIDAIANTKASTLILAEMLVGKLKPRVPKHARVLVLRASAEYFHSNSGAKAWFKNLNGMPFDRFKVLTGSHFGILCSNDGLHDMCTRFWKFVQGRPD